jgi:hypothetical protein
MHLQFGDAIRHSYFAPYLRFASRPGGIDIRRVQMWLGHQTLQMTMRYAHLATNDLDSCVVVLEHNPKPAQAAETSRTTRPSPRPASSDRQAASQPEKSELPRARQAR